MKLTVRQLRQLVRESVEEMHLGGDMDHHGMHLGDDHDDMDHDDMDHHGMQHGEHGDDNDYSHDEEMEDLIDQHGHEADEAERGYGRDQDGNVRLFEPYEDVKGTEEGEDLSSRSGMGRRLSESLKLVIREVIEECGCALEEEAIIEELMEKKMGFKKLTKSLAAKGAKNPKGLAYWIGKKKLGKAEMTKRAVEGKKKASK
jgi:hypothetical protein